MLKLTEFVKIINSNVHRYFFFEFLIESAKVHLILKLSKFAFYCQAFIVRFFAPPYNFRINIKGF